MREEPSVRLKKYGIFQVYHLICGEWNRFLNKGQAFFCPIWSDIFLFFYKKDSNATESNSNAASQALKKFTRITKRKWNVVLLKTILGASVSHQKNVRDCVQRGIVTGHSTRLAAIAKKIIGGSTEMTAHHGLKMCIFMLLNCHSISKSSKIGVKNPKKSKRNQAQVQEYTRSQGGDTIWLVLGFQGLIDFSSVFDALLNLIKDYAIIKSWAEMISRKRTQVWVYGMR